MNLKAVILVIMFVISGILYYQWTGYVLVDESTELVVRVIDGDTIELELGQRVRMKGINTPEKSEWLDLEATEFVRESIENKIVGIESYGFDKYGRMLAYVFVGDGNLNEEILERGLGTLYYYEEDEYFEDMRRAEEFARVNELGLWDKSDNYGCLKIEEFETDEPERLILENVCSYDLEIMFKDDATHIYEAKVEANSKYSEDFSHIWNTDGDSLYVYDGKGLLIFYRY